MKRFLLSSFLALVSYCMYAIDPNGARVDFGDSQGDSGSLVFMALVGMVLFPFVAFVYLSGKDKNFKWGCLSLLLAFRFLYLYCSKVVQVGNSKSQTLHK